jgi:protein tyrosine/serine phosphatase
LKENPCDGGDSLGDYDAGEEAVKGALRLALDGSAYPMLIVCSAGSHMSARLIGCLRRLQHWTMTAIIDEVSQQCTYTTPIVAQHSLLHILNLTRRMLL